MKNTRFMRMILLAVVIALTFVQPVFAAMPTSPSNDYFVSDFADVIEPEAYAVMVENGLRMAEFGTAQIALVTVDFTDGMDIATYATELFNSWGIGEADTNNGLLILMAIGDQDYWAVQGQGLEQILPSGEIKAILHEYLEPDFAAENYSDGALKTYRAFYEYFGGVWEDGGRSRLGQQGKYVSDQAGVLSQGAIANIEQLGEATYTNAGGATHVVVVQSTSAVDSAQPLAIVNIDMSDFAFETFYQRNMTGSDILFVMSIWDDDYYILPGEYVADRVDFVLDSIIENEIEPAFADGNYDLAGMLAAQHLSKEIENYAGGYSHDDGGGSWNYYDDEPYISPYRTGMVVGSIFPVIFLIIILVVVLSILPRRRYYRRIYGVPFNPFAPYYVRRYGPGGYWGRYGGPPPGFHPHMHYHHSQPYYGGRGPFPPPPNSGYRPGGGPASGGGNRPTGGGPSSGGGSGRPPSSGGSFGGFGGGSTRGGGAGRSSGSSFGGFSSGGSSRGGGFSGGGSRGGGGGGASRGGGAGRGR